MMQFTTIIKYYDSWASYKVSPGSTDYTVTLDGYKGSADPFPKFIKLTRNDISRKVQSYASPIEAKIANAIRRAEDDEYGIS